MITHQAEVHSCRLHGTHYGLGHDEGCSPHSGSTEPPPLARAMPTANTGAGVPLGLTVREEVGDEDAPRLGEAEGDSLALLVTEGWGVSEGERVTVGVPEAVVEGDAVAVDEPVTVGVPVFVGEVVLVTEADGVNEGVTETVHV
jgi:hypothetical protein